MGFTRAYVGIDNGVSGAIAILFDSGETGFRTTPVYTQQSYTKKKQNITRLNFSEMMDLMASVMNTTHDNVRVFIERPFTGSPAQVKQTISAMRCLEATLIVMELLSIPYEYVDSRQWQRDMLPKGVKGAAELKAASATIGKRLFPQYKLAIDRHRDADALLIAEWARRNQL